MKQNKAGNLVGWMPKASWDIWKSSGGMMFWETPNRYRKFRQVEVEVILKKVIPAKRKKAK